MKRLLEIHGSLGPAHNAAFHQLHHFIGSVLDPAETKRHYPTEGVQMEDRSQRGTPRGANASFSPPPCSI